MHRNGLVSLHSLEKARDQRRKVIESIYLDGADYLDGANTPSRDMASLQTHSYCVYKITSLLFHILSMCCGAWEL